MRSRNRGQAKEREAEAHKRAQREPLVLRSRAQREAAEKEKKSPVPRSPRNPTRRVLDLRAGRADSSPSGSIDWGGDGDDNQQARVPRPGCGNAEGNTEDAHQINSPAGGPLNESDGGSAERPRVTLGLLVESTLKEHEGESSDSSPVPCWRGTATCTNFAADGHCAYGNRCLFRHFSSQSQTRRTIGQ